MRKTWAGDKDNSFDVTHNRERLEFKVNGKVAGNDAVIATGTATIEVDKTKSVQVATLKTSGGKDLPKYYNGKPITYTITETSVPAGYTVSYGNSQTYTTGQSNAVTAFFSGLFKTEEPEKPDHTFKVTNTLVEKDFSFTKEYSGINKPTDKARAKFTLTAVNPTNTGIVSVTEEASDQNSYTFDDLKYGVVYKVEETTIPKGYEKAPVFYLKLEKEDISGKYVVKAYKNEICNSAVTTVTDVTKDTGLYLDDTAYKLKNFVKTADFSFTKAFDSKKPNTMMPTFTIKKIKDAEDNVISSSKGKTVSVTNGTDTYLFKDLECGTYTVTESDVTGYEKVEFQIQVTDPGVGQNAVASVVANSGAILPTVNGGTLTNIAKTTDMTLLKTYNGVYTGDAKFNFFEIDAAQAKPTAAVYNNGVYTFKDLKYGKRYKVIEIAPTGYQAVAPFTIEVVVKNGNVVAEIVGTVEGLTVGTQASGTNYVLDNKVKTTGFTFNKVFEENRNATTPSFVAYQLTKDSNGTTQV